MKARGFAKVNLSLRVHSPLPGGSHPITGIFQSIGWHDRLSLEAPMRMPYRRETASR